MRKKTMADGILGISIAAALASAPFQESSLAAGALFHLSFAASVGGFADWFGVTSLFRKPLGVPFRTSLISKSRDKIVAMARDMVTEEILSERRLKRLLVNHVPSAVVERWLKEHRQELSRILTDGLEAAFFLPPRGMAVADGRKEPFCSAACHRLGCHSGVGDAFL